MTSNFPNALDDDTTLPIINDNLTEIGGDAINAARDAIFAIEQNIGIGLAGSTNSLADRLGVSILPDGYIRPSALTGLGLVVLPITNSQVSNTAQIIESKLSLDHKTQDLYNYIQTLSVQVQNDTGWIASTGVKLNPHLAGQIYRHSLDQIDINPNPQLKNKFELLRDNTNAYTVVNDINNELLFHQFADGSFINNNIIITNDGSTYPADYAHTASGIWINTSRFALIPQTTQDLQSFADFIDNSSILLYGTRIQNLYSNGISRVSRSSSLVIDGYGSAIVPSTAAIAYLLNTGDNSNPFDDINTGDDIIEFKPSADVLSSNSFDEQFALVKIGDIIRINYGSVEVSFIIKEKKYSQNMGVKKFIIRIAGKNLFYAPNASARIDRSLVNINKYGVLAIAAANNSFSETPSLIVGSPRGSQALGLGFNIDQFDSTHYNLYLALYTTGNPQDGYTILPGIDITGNQGATSGQYTLDSIINTTNNAFRQVGYNYRFIAFSYQGEFGIMLADPYNNVGFSILNGVVDNSGFFNQTATQTEFPNNVVDVFAADGYTPNDPLGFGLTGSNVASPPYQSSYGSAEAALQPTQLFLPLKRNNYYVNGVEKEQLNLDIDQILDGYGDGYWFANINAQSAFPGGPPTGRVETTYRVLSDLSSSKLAPGKTLVVQSVGSGTLVDFGRFTIKSVVFSVCAPDIYTDITVYDSVHATGISPTATLGLGAEVAIYFSSDSVGFNKESATDFTNYSPFRRHFEVFVDSNGNTFTHERGRINISGSTLNINFPSVPLYGDVDINKLNIINIGPKLQGYNFGSVNKITLRILSYDDSLGIFDGYLASYDGTNYSHVGPIITGYKGEITRFYDETYNDYIDIQFDINTPVSTFTDRNIDFQLFPSLALDDEIMLLASCQLDDVSNVVSQIVDRRQFGNTSEKDLTTSAIDFIELPERLLHSNGIIRGFDVVPNINNPNNNQIFLLGGVALVNGKVIQVNDGTITIPPIKELYNSVLYNVDWLICLNDKGDYQPIPLLDFDNNISSPNNSGRIFNAYNVINGSTYHLDASTFSNVVNNRKDLTPIYLVGAAITAGTPPIFALTVSDFRKYINDADSNLPLKLTSAGSQGNFRNFQSIINWILFNSPFNGTALVQGASISTGTINENVILNFNNMVSFDGGNNAELTFNGLFTLGSNVSFKNATINLNGGVNILAENRNILFDNCVINYVSNLTSPTNSHFSFNFPFYTNVVFNNTTINATYAQPLTNSAVFAVNACSDFKVIDCEINTSFTASAGITTPADVFWITNTSGMQIINTTATGNFNKYINNISSSGMKIKDGMVQSSYDPHLDFSFNNLDVVNSGSGYIYANVSGILDSIEIDNVYFNYAPSVSSATRFSFINFEMTSITSVLSDCKITNNKFSDLNLGTAFDGYRAAISIINIAPSVAAPNFQPSLYNVDISHNACNKNQAIIVSSKTVPNSLVFGADYYFDGYAMGYPGLGSINASIHHNVCGTIGYWISNGTKIVNLPPNINVNNLIDKNSSLNIYNNTCHFIGSLTSRGQIFRSSRRLTLDGITFSNSLDMTPIGVGSGFVSITNNTANWIHTSIAAEEDSSLDIISNRLTAYDLNYLSTYGNGIDGMENAGYTFANGFATNTLLGYGSAINVYSSVATGIPFGNDGIVNIDKNTTNSGYMVNAFVVPVIYNYIAYIFCQSSNNISKNFLRGAGITGIPSYVQDLITVGGINNLINNNRIYREDVAISHYVAFNNPDYPAFIPSYVVAKGAIVDNFFDSPYTDLTLNDQALFSFPSTATRWIIERNINQTRMVSIPMTNSQVQDGYVLGFNPPPVASYTTIATNKAPTGKSNVLELVSLQGNTAEFIWQDNLDKYLPSGARLVDVKMALRPLTGTYANNAAIIIMTLNKYSDAQSYLDLNFSGGTDNNVLNDLIIYTSLPVPAPTGTQAYATISGAQLTGAVGVGTVEMEINPTAINGGTDISDQFISNAQGMSSPGFGLSVAVGLLSTAGNTDVYFSPIMIKYRW